MADPIAPGNALGAIIRYIWNGICHACPTKLKQGLLFQITVYVFVYFTFGNVLRFWSSKVGLRIISFFNINTWRFLYFQSKVKDAYLANTPYLWYSEASTLENAFKTKVKNKQARTLVTNHPASHKALRPILQSLTYQLVRCSIICAAWTPLLHFTLFTTLYSHLWQELSGYFEMIYKYLGQRVGRQLCDSFGQFISVMPVRLNFE